jgi:hypothetical protein
LFVSHPISLMQIIECPRLAMIGLNPSEWRNQSLNF